jgi:hypothetical protein
MMILDSMGFYTLSRHIYCGGKASYCGVKKRSDPFTFLVVPVMNPFIVVPYAIDVIFGVVSVDFTLETVIVLVLCENVFPLKYILETSTKFAKR